jgi:hypothetical protein
MFASLFFGGKLSKRKLFVCLFISIMLVSSPFWGFTKATLTDNSNGTVTDSRGLM